MPRPALALLLVGLLLTGCNKGNRADQPIATETANLSAVDLYNAKRYPDALTRAENDMLTAKGRPKEVAQLTAGLSAYALNKPAVAQTYLSPLAHSEDPQIAGRADAVLGQIAQQKGNPRYAADLFTRASSKLDGDDAARASARAGKSLSAVNKPAPILTPIARTPSQPDALTVKQAPSKSGQPGPYTIQVAAFNTRAGAEKRVAQLRPATIKAGMGSPRIVTDTTNGKTSYAVQVGVFADRPAAEIAKPKLGGGQYMIVAVD